MGQILGLAMDYRKVDETAVEISTGANVGAADDPFQNLTELLASTTEGEINIESSGPSRLNLTFRDDRGRQRKFTRLSSVTLTRGAFTE